MTAENSKRDTAELLTRAAHDWGSGAFDSALETYQRVREIDPSNKTAHVACVLLLLELNRDSDAAQLFESRPELKQSVMREMGKRFNPADGLNAFEHIEQKMARLIPDLSAYTEGSLHDLPEQPDESVITELTPLFERFGMSALRSADMNTALMYALMKRHENAEALVARSLAAHEGDFEVLTEAAFVYFQLKQHKKGIELCRQVLQNDPDDVRTRSMLAKHLAHDNQRDAAIAEFQAVLDAKPGHIGTARAYAYALSESEEYESAIEVLQRAAKHSDFDEDLACDLGKYQLHAKQIDEAVETFEEVMRRRSGHRIAEFYLTYAYRFAERWDDAADMATRAWRNYPDDSAVAETLLVSLNNLERFDEAAALGKTITSQGLHTPVIYAHYAYTLRMLGDADSAATVVQSAEEHGMRTDEVLEQFGYTLLDAEQHSDALDIFNELYDRNPKKTKVISNLAWIHDKLGHRDVAAAFCDELLMLDPQDGFGLELRASIYVEDGEPEAAEPLLTRAVEGGRDDWRTDYWRARCYIGLGRHAEAQDLLPRIEHNASELANELRNYLPESN